MGELVGRCINKFAPVLIRRSFFRVTAMRVIVLYMLMIFSGSVFCEGVADTFDVDFVRVDQTGFGYVEFKTNLVGTPASCTQSGYTKSLAFDANTAGGKAIMSLALAAKTSGRKILARGTGACAVYGVMEQWAWGLIK